LFASTDQTWKFWVPTIIVSLCGSGKGRREPFLSLIYFLFFVNWISISFVGDIWSIIAIQMMDSCWQVEDSKMFMGLNWCGKRTFMLTWIIKCTLKMEENGRGGTCQD
jgi:hypothetical protein